MNIKKCISTRGITTAWNSFLQSGEVNNQLVRRPIVESWIRSNESRVNPLGGVCQNVLEKSELMHAKERKQELLHAAIPLMEYYYQLIKNTGTAFVLVDESGYILSILGDGSVLEDAKKINFTHGASWTENEVGTNAIGTTLQIKKPLIVTASEHFCQKHHNWTCSAAPILDTNGKLLGVIDISGPFRTYNKHTLGIAAAIANSVTLKLIMQKKGHELSSLDKRLSHFFDNTSDGIVEVDANGIIKCANGVASALTKKPRQQIIGRSFDELFDRTNTPIMPLMKSSHSSFEYPLTYNNENKNYLICGETMLDHTGTVTGGIVIIKHVSEHRYLTNNNVKVNSPRATYNFSGIIGNCQAVMEAKQIASVAAKSMSNVLLYGESGTGKEMYAHSIHNESQVKNGPFVAVNCGAIPKELIGSELFGYEEGAFTGAKRGGRIGKFEIADGGTLFLDEIGDMPIEQQVALLRVLQERKFTRIGGNKDIAINTRIICATNKNLLDEVMKGSFRQDLYYRLNVISIDIPPLRECGEDITLLFNHFLRRHELSRGKIFEVDQEVIDCILKYHWPGNVRELENLVERLAAINLNGKIQAGSLPKELLAIHQAEPSEKTQYNSYASNYTDRNERKGEASRIEKQKIIYMLDKCHGNVSRAASELGISRNTLYRKIRTFEISN